MLPRLLLIAVLLTLAFLGLRWFLRRPPAAITAALRRAAWILVVGLLFLLAVRGQLNWLFAAIGAVIPLLGRLLPLIRYIPVVGQWYARYRAARGAGYGEPGDSGASRVESRFLRLEFDYRTGALDGIVLDGPLRGVRLSTLTLSQRLALWRDLRVRDVESARLLEAFLDRHDGDAWRTRATGDRGTGDTSDRAAVRGAMTREEAFQILDVAPTASTEDIIAAHRRLMQKLHPDRGGSTYLAVKINQAKDCLLGK